MADLPEYRSSVAISPAAQPQGFGEAMKEVGQKTYGLMSQISAEVAQKASNERQRRLGFENAKEKPGQQLFPIPLSEADAAYKESYLTQERAISYSDGTRFLDKLIQNSKKNPTANTLVEMEGIAQQGIHKFVENLNPENKEIVKRALEDKYLNGKYEVDAKVFNRGQEFIQKNLKRAVEAAHENMDDQIAKGNFEGASQTYDSIAKAIDSSYHLSPGEKEAYKQTLAEGVEIAEVRADMISRMRRGDDITKVMKDAGEAIPTHRNLRRAKTIYDTYKNQQAFSAAYDNMQITEIEMKRELGELTPFDLTELQAKISPERFAEFQLDNLKWINRQQIQSDNFEYFNANLQNPVALASLSSEQINEGFSRKVQEYAIANEIAPDFNAELNVAKTIDYPIPSFNKKISAGLNSSSPDIAVQMAQAYAAVKAVNPNAVSGVNGASSDKADLINSALSAQVPPLEAFKDATATVDGLSEAEFKRRNEVFDFQLRDKGYRDPVSQELLVTQQLGVPNGEIPSGLVPDYLDAFRSSFVRLNDWDLALAKTNERMSRVYGEETANGFKMYSKFPTNKMLPNGDNKFYHRNLIIDQSLKYFAGQEAQFHNPESTATVYYKFDEGTIRDVENEFYESRLTPSEGITGKIADYFKDKPYRVTRYQQDPYDDKKIHEIKGVMLVKSDDITQKPLPGQYPTYGLWFLPDGQNVPQMVYDADNYSQARFKYTEEDNKKAENLKLAKVQGLIELKKKNDENKKQAKELRDKIMEMRLELGEDLYYE